MSGAAASGRSKSFTLTDREICPRVAEMRKREKLTFVHDASGSIGVVMEFSESDFEAYSMPDLALIGAFQTKTQAAEALASPSHQLRH
jgi:hypothetical protein